MVRPHECAATKVCSSCGQSKTLAEFSARRSKCKACRVKQELVRAAEPKAKSAIAARRKAAYEMNAEQVSRDRAAYYKAHKKAVLKRVLKHQAGPLIRERRLQYNAQRYAMKRDEIRAQQANYYSCNPEVFIAKEAKRRAQLLRAMPAWAERRAIDAVYKSAEALSKATGVKYCVDHIVPLQGRKVSGLHVSWNLQVITMRENARKSNKHTG